MKQNRVMPKWENSDIPVQVYRYPQCCSKPMGEQCGFVPIPVWVQVWWVQVQVGPHRPITIPMCHPSCETQANLSDMDGEIGVMVMVVR